MLMHQPVQPGQGVSTDLLHLAVKIDRRLQRIHHAHHAMEGAKSSGQTTCFTSGQSCASPEFLPNRNGRGYGQASNHPPSSCSARRATCQARDSPSCHKADPWGETTACRFRITQNAAVQINGAIHEMQSPRVHSQSSRDEGQADETIREILMNQQNPHQSEP